jgi:uncharacterized membrane protein
LLELPLPEIRPEFDRNTSNAGMPQSGTSRLARVCVFFVPITTGSTYNATHKLVERDNTLPGAVLAAFAPLGGVVLLWAQNAAEGQLGS